jgi:hypothetical protein
MALTPQCPSCGKTLKVEERLIGKRVKCGACSHVFAITAPDPVEEAPVALDPLPETGRRQSLQDDQDSGELLYPARRRRPEIDDDEDWDEPSPRRRQPDNSGAAIAGMVLGILAMLAWCLPIVGLPISIVGLVMSSRGKGSSNGGLAIAGLVMNIIGLALALANAGLGAYLAVSGKHPLVNK